MPEYMKVSRMEETKRDYRNFHWLLINVFWWPLYWIQAIYAECKKQTSKQGFTV